MNVVAGVALTAVMCVYSTFCYAMVLRQREEDRRHFAKVAADIRNKARAVRADLDALMAYVGAQSPVDESGDDTAPMDLGEEIDADHHALTVRAAEVPEPAPVGDWQAEQDAWLEQELARLDELAKEEAA